MTKDKSGVRIETVGANHGGQRIDNYLSARLKGVPRSLVYRLIRTGQVRINGKRCKPANRLAEGDQVRIPPASVDRRGDAAISGRIVQQLGDSILYRDDDMLVVNKPSGMAVHAGSGLAWGVIDALRLLYPGEFLELVHRIDRETSGCLVLARNGKALGRLSEQFRVGGVDKRYLCLLDGVLPQAVVEVDAPLARIPAGKDRQVRVSPEGKPARTRFSLLQSFPEASYVEAELFTGRTHQIRVHAQHLGCPLAGDRRYADRKSVKYWRAAGLKRLFLHAHAIRLAGEDGRTMDFNAPLPEELRSVLSALE